jgi:predicted nucleotidyltransferase
MLNDQDRRTIAAIATRYRVKRVLLFGSAAQGGREPRDIDLAVEGVPAADFYDFCGDLLFGLSKPVDVVDLTPDTKFTRLVRRVGVTIYG